jgi:hypothetical protein
MCLRLPDSVIGTDIYQLIRFNASYEDLRLQTNRQHKHLRQEQSTNENHDLSYSDEYNKSQKPQKILKCTGKILNTLLHFKLHKLTSSSGPITKTQLQ